MLPSLKLPKGWCTARFVHILFRPKYRSSQNEWRCWRGSSVSAAIRRWTRPPCFTWRMLPEDAFGLDRVRLYQQRLYHGVNSR